MGRVLTAASLVAALVALVVSGAAPGKGPPPGHGKGKKHGSPVMSVFATGFHNPRGLAFGPDGDLYVAEAGLGGSTSTAGQCAQVLPPIGPYTGSTNDPVHGSRISKVSPAGVVSTVVDALPSSVTAPPRNFVEGVADVAFVHGELYGLLAGAGCSHGVATVPNGIIRVGPGNSWTLVANLSAFIQANPVAHPNLGDFEPDGTWYSMVAAKGALYAVEPNHGEVDRVSPTSGAISRLVDVSATYGHVVPTAIARHGVFYLGNLGLFGPADPAGDEHVYQLNPNGNIRVRASGLEKVLALAFHGGKLYALETSTLGGSPVPGTGAIVRVRAGHPAETIVSGLAFPTGMAIGSDGAFYVSVNGFGPLAGAGEIVKITTH
ncbi:MAG: ScyD/ScyE family protein [Gaiellaceae bacterium]